MGCTALDFLATASFTATPTTGISRLKVEFRDGSTLYNAIEEVEQSTVDRYIAEAACDTYAVIEVPK